MLRIGLFALVNLGVMLTLMMVLNLLGVRNYLTPFGINYESLMIFCLVYGMGGAFISLLISKKMAKWTMGLKVIDPRTASGVEKRLWSSVDQLARGARLPKTPEVALYQSPEVNAFATGPSKGNALVAVSTGLLQRMDEQEVEGVLAHEVSHIANGDMVTMTLVQGVINAFVMFFAKAVAWAIANAMRGDDEESTPSFFVVFAIEMVLYVVFGLLGSLVVSWFSRYREFRADAGAASLAGSTKIIAALEKLKSAMHIHDERGEAIASLKISSGKKSFLDLLSTHPPLEERISRLQRYRF